MTIAHQLLKINQAIHAAARESGRQEDAVTLVVVTKNRSVQQIQEAISAGQRHFGESYLQEAVLKINALKDDALQWHFIGTIQSNKTRLVAEHFSWVHSVTRCEIAERLNAERPQYLPPLNVCVQINISHETTKSGLAPEALSDFMKCFKALSRLRLRGFMVIPRQTQDFQEQLKIYNEVTQIFRAFIAEGWQIDTLSMGMSNDFRAAICAGSTMVRLGRAIFSKEKE